VPSPPPPPSPFLNPDPPHWAARGLSYVLLLLFAGAVAVAILLRVPETVATPFVLQPQRGADPVKASRGGIVAAVHATEGQNLEKGAPLFVIRSVPLGERAADLRSFQAQVLGHDASLANIRREQESQQQADREEAERLQLRLAHLARSIEFKKEEQTLLKQVVTRFETLHKEGLIGWTEYAEQQLEANKVQAEMEGLESDIKETQKSVQKLAHESAARLAKFQEQVRQLDADRDKARIRIDPLQSELLNSKTNELTMFAPCAGTVLRLRVNSPGAYVPEGDVLCELACGGERLQAELAVPQKGLGRLQPGQAVKLLYDAFPYQRYGVQYGTVRWVSPASLASDPEVAFRAFVDLDDATIRVDGQPRSLKAGMRGTARVVVSRVRLITYAFEPLRQLRENLAASPRKPHASN
jgi:membrane fusion protein